MTIHKYLIAFVAGFSIFVFGVTFEHYKYPPYSFLLNAKNSLINFLVPISREGFELCDLPAVSHVEEGSHAFIGHAYGRETDFLALNILNFIGKNNHKLKSVSFTGDVFAVPSLKKWARLSALSESHMIFIAPGNHDVARPDSLDVFNLRPFGNKVPFLEQLDGFPVVYDDSVSSN